MLTKTCTRCVRPFAALPLGLLLLFVAGYCSKAQKPVTAPPAPDVRWDPFLDTLQERTLRFFLETTPANGLALDRYPSPSPCSMGAVGFALTTYPIAAERGLITRMEAAQRAYTTLSYLFGLPQHDGRTRVSGYKGFFYHFVDTRDGSRAWSCELSTIDTGLMLMGALFCQSYFEGKDSLETGVRNLADSLYRRVDWVWATDNSPGISHGWHPEEGFNRTRWRGYDESAFLIMLALGSPTHPVRDGMWDFWVDPCVWAEYYGFEFISFAPLFGHQYSHCWIDFRGIRDSLMSKRGIDYFENSRRATLSQRLYAIDNPGRWQGYSDSVWGLTACDGPGDTTLVIDGESRRFIGYGARGASFDWVNDDGTLAPTAAGGSLPFAPEICIPALKAMRSQYGDRLWRTYGFADAFNPTFVTPATGPGGWVDPDYLGIDQGPIAIMIENLRNGFVWTVMKKNPYIRRGLTRAGFTGGWLDKQ